MFWLERHSLWLLEMFSTKCYLKSFQSQDFSNHVHHNFFTLCLKRDSLSLLKMFSTKCILNPCNQKSFLTTSKQGFCTLCLERHSLCALEMSTKCFPQNVILNPWDQTFFWPRPASFLTTSSKVSAPCVWKDVHFVRLKCQQTSTAWTKSHSLIIKRANVSNTYTYM